jgi:hypothetical protein
MDSLALRLTPSWSQGFAAAITRDAAQATTCVIGISHDELLAVHERTQAFLTHRMPRIFWVVSTDCCNSSQYTHSDDIGTA